MPDDPDYQPGVDDPLDCPFMKFRPAQVMGHRRFNGIYCPFMKFLIALVQASGEDMILPAIQLLRVALVTRLLLLLLIALMIIATLVTLINLIVMSTLITVEA